MNGRIAVARMVGVVLGFLAAFTLFDPLFTPFGKALALTGSANRYVSLLFMVLYFGTIGAVGAFVAGLLVRLLQRPAPGPLTP